MAEEIKSNKSMKFDKIQIKLASPENILEWSHGEVTKPHLYMYFVHFHYHRQSQVYSILGFVRLFPQL